MWISRFERWANAEEVRTSPQLGLVEANCGTRAREASLANSVHGPTCQAEQAPEADGFSTRRKPSCQPGNRSDPQRFHHQTTCRTAAHSTNTSTGSGPSQMPVAVAGASRVGAARLRAWAPGLPASSSSVAASGSSRAPCSTSTVATERSSIGE